MCVVKCEINSKMKEKKENCQNCGHDCHCEGKCEQEIVNEFGEKYKIECCRNCRH